jgi:hypothetical protein
LRSFFGRFVGLSRGGGSGLNSIAGTFVSFEPRHSYTGPAARTARIAKASKAYRIGRIILQRVKTAMRRG